MTALRPPARWLHTHGLAELGRFDLDIVGPHPDFVAACADPIRTIATMVLEGDVTPDQAQFSFGHPDGDARLVPVRDFMREADPTDTALRDADHHDERRSVLCEPAVRKVFGLGRGDRPEPLHLARRTPPDQFVLYLPTSTTTLMAERAQATIDVLRALIVEFAEFEVVAVVKLGYPTEGDGKEHLWFTAHAIGASTIDATLENRPFEVDLQPGERAERPLEYSDRLDPDDARRTGHATLDDRSAPPARTRRRDPRRDGGRPRIGERSRA